MAYSDQPDSSAPFLSYKDYNDFSLVSSTLKRRRKLLLTLGAVVSLAIMVTLSTVHVVNRPGDLADAVGPSYFPNHTRITYPDGVKGPPTPRFRDNLLENRGYLISWPAAGWTNDVMAYGNTVYLALITGRIPVMPPFTPSHIGGDAENIPFGEVFDVPRLRSLINSPVVEWHDLKARESDELEHLGCWSIWQSQQYYEYEPRMTWLPQELHLDIAYTKSPSWVKSVPGNEHDKSSYFFDLAKLAFPEARDEYLNSGLDIKRTPSPIHHMISDPDDHLLCMDYLYYVTANPGGGFEADYSPAWRFAVTHMHFTQRIESIASKYVRSMFELAEHETIPPFITIHMRRGDFGSFCNDTPKDECFPSLATIYRRVREVKEELAEKYPGMSVEHVIMTSDEREEAWWDQVAELGWYTVDHSKTVEEYGRWYPVIIDATIQSMSMGFVGTFMSTFSILAGRRVEDWQGGASRMIKWGSLHADDH